MRFLHTCAVVGPLLNQVSCFCLDYSIGQREFVNMLPLVCNDAVAILFMFDLTRKSTLNSVKEWYRQARGFNKASRLAVNLPFDHCSSPQTHLLAELSFSELCRPPTAWTIPLIPIDGYSVPCRHQIRQLFHFPPRRAGGDNKAGEAICQGNARESHLFEYQCEHQRTKDLQDCASQGELGIY